MTIIIDRFEGNFIIFEEIRSGEIHKIPKHGFENFKEGDVVDFRADGSLYLLREETKKRRNIINKKMSTLKGQKA